MKMVIILLTAMELCKKIFTSPDRDSYQAFYKGVLRLLCKSIQKIKGDIADDRTIHNDNDNAYSRSAYKFMNF